MTAPWLAQFRIESDQASIAGMVRTRFDSCSRLIGQPLHCNPLPSGEHLGAVMGGLVRCLRANRQKTRKLVKVARHGLAVFNLRAIQRIDLEENRPGELARSRGCLDFALHKSANVAHGDSEIVLGLHVDPELRSVAENNGRGASAVSAVTERCSLVYRRYGLRDTQCPCQRIGRGRWWGIWESTGRYISKCKRQAAATHPRLDGGAALFRVGHCRFNLILSR
jgi:hypothetical protein